MLCSVSSEEYEEDEDQAPQIENQYDNYFRRSRDPEAKPGQLPHHVMFVRPYSKAFPYRVFCGGSIITELRVLTTASCFVTPKKRHKHDISLISVVAGLLKTTTNNTNATDQWRKMKKIYTQKYFSAPSYDLAVVEIDNKWVFSNTVKKIAYASVDQDFDGVCISVAIKPSSSWSTSKLMYVQERQMIRRKNCEKILLISCRLFYCTVNKVQYATFTELEGSGLVCYDTGDPIAKAGEGILVGVSSNINNPLPSLYSKVALYNKWITDGCEKFSDKVLLVIIMSFIMIKIL